MRINSALIILLAAVTSSIPQVLFAQQAGSSHEGPRQFITTDADAIVIRNVRLVDGTGAAARDDQTIVIRNGRLERIGENIDIAPEAEVIDGSRLTALPQPTSIRSSINGCSLWVAISNG